jgi:RNA polymerase sigma-70 factor (ECF subfamily)
MKGAAALVELSDAQLLALSGGLPEAFGVFYSRRCEAVLAYCYRRTGCAQTAADLTAEVFAAAFVKRQSFRDTGAPGLAWLYGIAARQIGSFARHRRVADRYRRRFGLPSLVVADDDLNRIEDLVDLSAVRDALDRAVAALPPGLAQAVQMRVCDERSYPDIAAALGCSEGAARVRVSRALSRLADAMEVPT